MPKCEVRPYVALTLFASALLAVAMLLSCSNGSMQNPFATTTETITTSISDPPTCAAPTGPFRSVWVTITRVRAHISGDAGPNDSGWVDLVNLTSNPRQIDLLSLESTACILNQLGSTSGLPPGKYQQIRLYLLANDATAVTVLPTNNCSGVSTFNCVDHQSLGLQALLLSSEAQTGIKIPPGQIAGGGIELEAGQSTDLDIHFNACASVLQQGNGQFRLKPTLRAGVVSLSLSQNSLSGRVVDGSAAPPTPLLGAIVLLEQPDPDEPSMNRVVNSKLTGPNGSFVFCPLPAGNYDVVVAARTVVGAVTITYNATIAFNVPLGTNLGDIPLMPETGASTAPASIKGQVTTADNTAVIMLSPLQDATPTGGPVRKVTIPVFDATSQPPNVETAAPTTTCPGGAPSCADYTLLVPASKPQVGTFSFGAITYAPQLPATPVPYNVNGLATTCGSPPPSSLTTASPVAVTPAPPDTTVSTPLAFTGCTTSP